MQADQIVDHGIIEIEYYPKARKKYAIKCPFCKRRIRSNDFTHLKTGLLVHINNSHLERVTIKFEKMVSYLPYFSFSIKYNPSNNRFV